MTINLNSYRVRRAAAEAAARAYHPAVRPIWMPNDAILTAQDFHADIANAERGELVEPKRLGDKLFSVSRFRRAKIMDAIAVALLMALAAAFGVIVFASTAKADTIGDQQQWYIDRNGPIVCSVLDDFNSISGLIGVMQGIANDGWTARESGQIAAVAVFTYCPRHIDLLDEFIALYGENETA